MQNPFFTTFLLLIFLPMMIFEIWWFGRKGRAYDFKGTAASVGVYLGTILSKLLLSGAVFVSFVALYEHRIATIPMTKPIHWIALFFGVEFTYYWFHRVSHEVRWFWATHAVHHTPNNLNLVSALRLGWTGTISGSILFWVPLVWLGFPPAYVFGMLSANLLYQFLLHTEMFSKLPKPIEWFFNTPSHHRVHHAANPEYLDTNYGGIVIIFDRLFGTFAEERQEMPPVYGLVHPLTSHNPFVIALHEWAAMLRDLRSARSLRDAAGYLFGPPGWSPDGSRETTASLKAKLNKAEPGQVRSVNFGKVAQVTAALAAVIVLAILR